MPGESTPRSGVLGASSGAGGVVLDAYGGLHPFGGVNLNAAGAPYWPGWDIVRSLAVMPGGAGGWTLDAYGGIHPWGAAPQLRSTAYWPGWDIARALYVEPDGSGGYLLDGYGGIHPLGDAPPLSGYPYWSGWDIVRGLDIHLNGSGTPDGGWVLDGYGGIHNFGAAPPIGGHYAGGYDVYQALHVVAGGAYQVARYGIVEMAGSPAGISWNGFPSWGTWDITRDVVPVDATLPYSAQPLDRGSAAGMMARFQGLDRIQRGRSWMGADNTLTGIAGNGARYNVAGCGGPSVVIGDRSADMYSRNYFDHAIVGCAGTQYVFSTYLRAYNVSYSWAGENIAWRVGDNSLMDDVVAINQMWLNSPPHYANIVGPFSAVGCGVYSNLAGSYQGASGGTWIWTCEFKG